MAVTAVNTNRATPSFSNLAEERSINNTYYFSLHGNNLSGAYKLLGDAANGPCWGDTLSNASGALSKPLVITVTGNTTLHCLSFIGDVSVWPTRFTYTLTVNGSDISFSFVNTMGRQWLYKLDRPYNVSKYVLTITDINVGNCVARVSNVYAQHILSRSRSYGIGATLDSLLSSSVIKQLSATFGLTIESNVGITNIMDKKSRTYAVDAVEDHKLTNIHTKMKEPTRLIYGKLAITYMSPLKDELLTYTTSGSAADSNFAQTSNGAKDGSERLFRLNVGKLNDIQYVIGDAKSERGWWSSELSLQDGTFATDPYFQVSFTARLLTSLTIISSKINDIVLVNYSVQVTTNGVVNTYTINNNTYYECPIPIGSLPEVTCIKVIVHKVNRPNVSANITEIPLTSTVTYENDDIISFDTLEELSYDDDLESLGAVSANEIDIMLYNRDTAFFFNNANSLVSKQLKKNRKIVAYLGTEVVPGVIEWYRRGTYWTYSWDVPANSLYAHVVAFDTIGLINTFTFSNHTVYRNYSIGALLDLVLNDAKQTYTLLEWHVDPDLYNVTIPYAWFEVASHAKALQRIAGCYRMNIYCDIHGVIQAVKRREVSDVAYDEWADNTNVYSSSYPTLYTSKYNTINVKVTKVEEAVDIAASTTTAFNIASQPTLTLISQKPIVGNVVPTVVADSTVSYTYDVHSWGVVFSFTGSGNVQSVSVSANMLNIYDGMRVTSSNAQLVQIDGPVSMDVSSDFIQSVDYAKNLADTILESASLDRYDAEVRYRGDISLSINDSIRYLNSVAPTNRFRIRSHELRWDGALSGTAKINT